MGIEKLIEGLKKSCWGKSAHVVDDERRKAATALSTLQAENAQLREELEYEQEHANAYYEECGQWEAENEKLRGEVESLKKGHCAGCSIPAVKAEQIRDLTDAPKLRAELEQVKQERYVAIEYLREIEWCAGCKHFGGLDGCKKWAMGQCTEKHDLYEFVGPQKED